MATVDRLERILRWHIEQSLGPFDQPCARCGHALDDHVDDEGALCLFPATRGAPSTLCHCVSYVPQSLGD